MQPSTFVLKPGWDSFRSGSQSTYVAKVVAGDYHVSGKIYHLGRLQGRIRDIFVEMKFCHVSVSGRPVEMNYRTTFIYADDTK